MKKKGSNIRSKIAKIRMTKIEYDYIKLYAKNNKLTISQLIRNSLNLYSRL